MASSISESAIARRKKIQMGDVYAPVNGTSAVTRLPNPPSARQSVSDADLGQIKTRQSYEDLPEGDVQRGYLRKKKKATSAY